MLRKISNNGQTMVIGFLLLLALAVGVIVYIQISVFPEINKRTEIDSQSQSVRSMVGIKSSMSETLSSGTSQSRIFINSVEYFPQPAAPPDQYGQLSVLSGPMRVSDAEIKIGETEDENNNTVDVTERVYINEDSNTETLNDIITTYQYKPSYIELNDDSRTIKMDNTIIYEQNPQNNRIKHSGQSIVTGRHINLIAVSSLGINGIKQQRDISIQFNPIYKISGPVRGTSDGFDDIEIELYTTEPYNDEWSDLESRNDNIKDISVNDNTLQIILDGTPENADYYNFNFIRARLQFK
jgi:hypothetical protein